LYIAQHSVCAGDPLLSEYAFIPCDNFYCADSEQLVFFSATVLHFGEVKFTKDYHKLAGKLFGNIDCHAFVL